MSKEKSTYQNKVPSSTKPAALRLKVCGMKANTTEVAALKPDYLGFIFYAKSPRNFDLNKIPKLPAAIKKVGVFVNAELNFVLEKIQQFDLDAIQLHGSESPEYCLQLKKLCQIERSRDSEKKTTPSAFEVPTQNLIELWKVFSIKDTFDFSVLEDYEDVVDMFLFDTKGKEKGGNGYTFDWEVLKKYPSQKPFILSGGIGLAEISSVKEFLQLNLPLYAIDVNSKFELEPGLKNIEDLKNLVSALKK
ncbi:phosphoribosylanthranilate isomerase [Leeuwenhoekiella sp. NPDC079379]|uniref:phosphoribosylanthranilate isomerase n=1 Tax=Leeuwenhoekiella sp. NPDC079379 TaxID=3364122 RepID=UPI0037C7235A